jgi:Skp family chaperone for outer membrane proteins
MTFKSSAARACVAAITLAAASSAVAQTAPAQAPIAQGPAIAGMCVISVEGAIGGSTVGRYVSQRLQQISQQANAELSGENNAIEAEAKSLDGQRGTLDQSALEQRAAALQVRGNALQRKAQLRERELQATEQKALGRVAQEMEPLVSQAYQQKGCSILLQRTGVVIVNPAMDITPQVVTALNGKITQFAFDREHLDQPQAQGGGSPAIIQTPSPAARAPVARPPARK